MAPIVAERIMIGILLLGSMAAGSLLTVVLQGFFHSCV